MVIHTNYFTYFGGFIFYYSVCVCGVLVAQLYPTLCDPMDCSPLGSSVHGIFQTRTLEWVAISSPRGSFPPRDLTGSPALQADSSPSEPFYLINLTSWATSHYSFLCSIPLEIIISPPVSMHTLQIPNLSVNLPSNNL